MSVPRLPAVPSAAEWPALRRHHDGWPAAMREICARHGLPPSELSRTRDGTSVVFTTERQVVKLYPPFWASGAAAEAAILDHVDEQLGVRTPVSLATGHLDEWPYLVMTRLEGAILADIWPSLDGPDRRAIARELGEVLHRLHGVSTSALSAHSVLAERWQRLVATPIADCMAVHRGHGTPETWVSQLSPFFDGLPPLHPERFNPVLLHGDVHVWHLLVAERDGHWRLVGLIDFDDAMLGWWEYDLAVPSISFLAGQPAVLAECLRGYGQPQLAGDERLPERLMAYALLNRYWGLDFILQQIDPDRRCATFADLERVLFAR